jgi:hypothetical protein
MATATSSSEITLQWNAPADNGGPGVGGFLVYRDGMIVAETLVTQFVDTGLLPIKQYCYRVVAFDVAGNKAPPSVEACITTPLAPSAVAYYVDYAEGSDANPGTSQETAWQHCPGDFDATGVAASAALNPGDTVMFKGGVQYVLTGLGIDLNWSGTPEQPITYDGNSAGTWGEGNAILVGPADYFVRGFLPAKGSNIAFTQSIFVGPVGKANPNGNSYVLQFEPFLSNGVAATDTYIEQTNADGSPNLYNGNPWFLGSANGFSLAYEMVTNSLGTNMYVIEAGSPPSPTNTVLFYAQSE